MAFTTLYRRARLATLAESSSELGLVDDGAVLVRDGRIAYAGATANLPAGEAAEAESVDCEGRLVTPGLIDCHTHLVHGGERSNEFEMRLAGAAYEEIARAGGGIVSSVKATRAASDADLLASALERLDRLIAEAFTMVEVKSGYGLDLSTEARMLRTARSLGKARDVGVKTSFLGAHALPPEAGGDKDGYSRLVAEEMLPALHAEGLVDAVDGFCEGIAFSPAEIARVFDAARALGLPVKLHADQLSDSAARSSRRATAPCQPIISNTASDAGGRRARRGRHGWRCCCPAPATSCARSAGPPVDGFRPPTVPAWQWRPTITPARPPLTSLLMAANMAATLFRPDSR